ncbi:DUF551 domain-containing protein [Klebsiella sp. NPDC088457]
MIPDKDLTDDVLDEIIAGAKTSMEQYLALSLKAERKVWRQEGPTDDERIMAIEGIHNCERCGDEGWVVGEMGITRCACGQAGNSPVIPDGSVSMLRRWLAFGRGMQNAGSRLPHNLIAETEDILASAPQLQNSPQNIPKIIPVWIPVSERMPEKNGMYQVWNGKHMAAHSFFFGSFQCINPEQITHWMPLPAAPQEVNHG